MISRQPCFLNTYMDSNYLCRDGTGTGCPSGFQTGRSAGRPVLTGRLAGPVRSDRYRYRSSKIRTGSISVFMYGNVGLTAAVWPPPTFDVHAKNYINILHLQWRYQAKFYPMRTTSDLQGLFRGLCNV
jgi:hypothetical protein